MAVHRETGVETEAEGATDCRLRVFPSTSVGADRDAAPSRRLAAKTQLILGYIGVGLAIVQGICLVPLYLRFIGGRMYGFWLATGGVTLWLSTFDLGISGLMGQRIAAAYGRRDIAAVGAYYSSGILLQGLVVTLIFIGALIIAWLFPPILTVYNSEVRMLRWSTLIACASMAVTFFSYGQKNTADALQRPLIPLLWHIGGSVLGLITTVILLYLGDGLYAIPVGMLVASLLSAAGTALYVRQLLCALRVETGPTVTVLKELLRLSPWITFSKAGNALVGRIEPTLIAMFAGPELALSYSLTKRAADIVQSVLEKIVGAVSAGFAHVVAEGDSQKAMSVLRLVWAACFAVGVPMLVGYTALNASFLSLWVHGTHFAGLPVTAAIAISILSLFFSNSFAYLLGAAGEIAVPAFLTGTESVVRIGVMAVLMKWLGLVGVPIAICITTGILGITCAIRLSVIVGRDTPRHMPVAVGRIIRGIVGLAAGCAIGYWWKAQTWTTFVSAAFLIVSPAFIIAIWTEAPLRKAVLARFKP